MIIRQFKAMGCPCEIRITADQPERLLSLCLDEVKRFEDKYSRYLPESAVSHINRAAGERAISIDEETSKILDYADVCFKISAGRFDITSGVLRTIWHNERTSLPSDAEIAAVLSKIGWNHVERQADSVFLPFPGMEIDLGGVVKEYVADALVGLLKREGAFCALINLGGDISVTGPQPDGSPWQIGIADPADSSRPIATISLPEGAITTSGGYERFIEIDGERYSHLLDPTTGWPVASLSGVSVVAKQAVVAGSISTIALLNDEPDGQRWLEASEAPYLAIASDGSVSGTLV